MRKFLGWLAKEESGQGMVEYGLIIILIAIVSVTSLLVLGPKIAEVFTTISKNLKLSAN